MRLKTLTDIDVRNKIVLLRVDFNIELEKDGSIAPWEEFKIRQILPTLEYLLKKRCRIILLSHRGRPNGVDKSLSLEPIVEHFKKMLKGSSKVILRQAQDDILFFNSIYSIHPETLKPGIIAMAENIRFHRGEELGDLKFAKGLAALGDVYVNDAFSVVHDNHASISKLPTLLPSAAGFGLGKEFAVLNQIVRRPKRPFTVILAGGKADTKFPLIGEFLKRADYLFIGGVLANTMLKSAGYPIGSSLYEKKLVDSVRPFVESPRMLFLQDSLKEDLIVDFDRFSGRNLRKLSKRMMLPFDVGVGIIGKREQRDLVVDVSMDITEKESILDIGQKTSAFLLYLLKRSGEVLWNGPLGYFEDETFAVGTEQFVRSINSVSTKVVIGGGETVSAFYKFGGRVRRNVTISSGGGAMLEFFLNQKLPGLVPLMK